MPLIPLTAEDHIWIHHAKARGPVIVEHDGHARQARLIAWKPHHNGRRTNKARVQFPSGRRATVATDRVTAREEIVH